MASGNQLEFLQPRRNASWLAGASIALAVAFAVAPASPAAAENEWIGTWTASPQPVWGPDFFAPLDFPRNLWNQTIRQVARVSIGGDRVRIVLSNEYGDMPLTIGPVRVGLSGGGETQ